MSPLTYRNADTLWSGVVEFILDQGSYTEGSVDPLSPGSGFGEGRRSALESLGASFQLLDPRARLVSSPVRSVNLASAAALAIWTLTGSDDLESIAFYNPRGAAFSDNGVTLAAALGARIFRSAVGDQFAEAAERLASDPGSRRAMVSVFNATDLKSRSRDVSCTADLHFLIRDGALHCIVHMRSQSAFGVLPYDLFVLTMIHEALSVRLDVPLGSYTTFCGSLHIYDDEVERARCAIHAGSTSAPPMPPMPTFTESDRERLAHAEAQARFALLDDPQRPMLATDFGMSDYWGSLLSTAIEGARSRLLNSTPA